MRQSSELARAVALIQQAAPRSQLLSELFAQIAEQVRYDAEEVEREAHAMRGESGDDKREAAIAFREGAARTLREEARRWIEVAGAFADAPSGRDLNPDNFAYVKIGRGTRT
ncbi:hypothetical protein ONR57_16310 [Hoyosella sp. YIM 151337]|uniref:hypothetical protein n=1 Tax=Hoyosella sp. YIM 151337 TaxID=2992742 RepID=UPI002235D5CB|nr:hypothetical protein [Hoyosella sp. YIM 151337]MCW4354869.1 hypothetical protein [Hoyosella sp. YIM 151337]